MDGLHELVPRSRRIQIKDRSLEMRQLRIGSYAEIEAEVLARKPSPLAVVADVVKEMPLEQAEYLLGRAYDDSLKLRRAAPRDIDSFLSTVEGLSFILWLSVRDAQPDVTRELILEWLYTLSEAEIARIQGELEQLEPDRGNVAGRPSTPAVANGVNVPSGAVSSAN